MMGMCWDEGCHCRWRSHGRNLPVTVRALSWLSPRDVDIMDRCRYRWGINMVRPSGRFHLSPLAHIQQVQIQRGDFHQLLLSTPSPYPPTLAGQHHHITLLSPLASHLNISSGYHRSTTICPKCASRPSPKRNTTTTKKRCCRHALTITTTTTTAAAATITTMRE